MNFTKSASHVSIAGIFSSGMIFGVLMLSVITVAIPSTSTTAERGIEMSNIAAAANLAELGRRIRTARTKLHWSQEAFAGVCGSPKRVPSRTAK